MGNDIIVNPAEEIKNKMKQIGISQQELAHLLGIPTETLKRKLLRDRTMDIEFIYNIQCVLGIKDNRLIEYEYKYREFEEKEEDFIDEYNKIKDVYKVLEVRNLIEKTSDIKDTVKNFRKFMEVSSYSKFQKEFHVTKEFNLTEEDKLFLFAWIQIGLKKIRNPQSDISEKDGVIFNLEEPLKDLPVKAYSKKLPSGKIFIQVDCRLSKEDIAGIIKKVMANSQIYEQLN